MNTINIRYCKVHHWLLRYYLLKKRAERGELNIAQTVKDYEDKARSSFQSENEKTKEIKYRVTHNFQERTDSINLKTLKNAELEPPASSRKANPNDIIIEFKEKITFNATSNRKQSEDPKRIQGGELNKKKSMVMKDEDVVKASKSEGKPSTKIGMAL